LLLLHRLGQGRRPSGSFGEAESSRRPSAKTLTPIRWVARRPAPRAASRCAELALRHNMVLASFTRPQRPLPALSTTPTRLLKCRAEQYWDSPRFRSADSTKMGTVPGDADSPLVRFGTVGCVAVDRHGNLAAGTSTGGLAGKLPGPVRDSPLTRPGPVPPKRPVPRSSPA